MYRYLCISFATLVCISCGIGPKPPADALNETVEGFIYGSLALSPVSATASGYHTHKGITLDEQLDDFSAAGMRAQSDFLAKMERQINELPSQGLDKEQLADIEILRNQIGLSKLELETIQSYKHNPTTYVELAGNALFTPYMLNYAPIEKRFEQITRRLEKLPTLFAQAKANLVDAPEVWNRVAQEENQGNIDMIDKTLREAAPAAQKAAYEKAAGPAIAALKDFNQFLKGDFSKQISDWRLGARNYDQKFRYTMAIGKAPLDLLREAEDDFMKIRAEMEQLARPKSVSDALADIAKKHATQATFMDRAKETLAQATAFVKAKDMMTLPTRGNLQVIETPEFMRGIYAVAGFNPAPPLQPELGAFYWVTPIPATWAPDRIDSKLREYNEFGMQQITIHEAMPGHYVQLEYANDVQPVSRRLLRNLYANGPYVEGYAVYAQQLMSEAGYMSDSKEMQLTFLKQMLRVTANAIMDIRFHTVSYTEREAMDLMTRLAYQEKEEATAKFQRAQLSSCQLPTYYAGWKGWLNAREEFKKKQGSAYSLKQFNERALKESAVPLDTLTKLLN